MFVLERKTAVYKQVEYESMPRIRTLILILVQQALYSYHIAITTQGAWCSVHTALIRA